MKCIIFLLHLALGVQLLLLEHLDRYQLTGANSFKGEESCKNSYLENI